VEQIKDNPIPNWDGRVYVSLSGKLEHGKTRALYACDTVSYIAFEQLLRPIENSWLGKRVVLDPGNSGHAGIVNRVNKLRKKYFSSVMLDYDDFNSQHTLVAQQIVIDELCNRSTIEKSRRERLVSSFGRMEIYEAGVKLGTAQGTLMSGHRGTSVINSILNAAYIELMLGSDVFSEVKSIHVGDDVYMAVPSAALLDRVVGSICERKFRMNVAKQSIGTRSCEFLRINTSETGAFGYLARSVSSCVSGNWVNEFRLNPLEGLATIVTHSRTLINRSRNEYAGEILVESAHRMTGLKKSTLKDILAGRASWNGSPTWGRTTVRDVYSITEVVSSELLSARLPAHATHDYLSNCATDLELYAMSVMDTGVTSAMLKASYSKSFDSTSAARPQLHVCKTRDVVGRGAVHIVDALRLATNPGVLVGQPLLHLMKNGIPRYLLASLVEMAGGDPQAKDLWFEAWGERYCGVVIDGWMSYTDAAMVAKKAHQGVVWTSFPYYI